MGISTLEVVIDSELFRYLVIIRNGWRFKMREILRKFRNQSEPIIILELWLMMWLILAAIPSIVFWCNF